MGKILKIGFVFILLCLACLSPLSYVNSPVHDQPSQYSWEENSFSALEINPNHIKTSPPSNGFSHEIVSILILFLAFSPRRPQIRRYVLSIIPILKILLILYPLKYKSRYLAQLPVL